MKKRAVTLSCVSIKKGNKLDITAIPLKIHSSVQTGRNYLIMYYEPQKRLFSVRLDSVKSVSMGEICEKYDKYYEYYEKNKRRLWGTTEILIRILSFGPVVEVLKPEAFREKIAHRIRNQRRLSYTVDSVR